MSGSRGSGCSRRALSESAHPTSPYQRHDQLPPRLHRDGVSMYILCYMIGVPPPDVISLRDSLAQTYETPLVLHLSILALVAP
jgi:hypothetical protein